MDDVDGSCLAELVLWVDCEISNFVGAATGKRGLGSLRLPVPPGKTSVMHQRGVAEGGEQSEVSFSAATKCLEAIFREAEGNMNPLGMPLSGRIAQLLRENLGETTEDIRRNITEEFKHLL